MKKVLFVFFVFCFLFMSPSVDSMDELNTRQMRGVVGEGGVDLRFDLRLNSDESGNKNGDAEFIWSDPDGSSNLGIPQAGHIGFETVILQLETGMDDSTEHGTIDIGQDTLDGTTEEFVEIMATDNDPNTQINTVNDDDLNNGLFNNSDVTFENVDFEVRDTRIKYFEGGNAGGQLGQFEFQGDLGLDGTKLRAWEN